MMIEWKENQDLHGNRFDTFQVSGDRNTPNQFIMLCKDERGFYFTYYMDVETVFFQEQIDKKDWDEARSYTMFKIENYLEQQQLKWKAAQWYLQQRFRKD